MMVKRLKIMGNRPFDVTDALVRATQVGAAILFIVHPNGELELGFSAQHGHGKHAKQLVDTMNKALGGRIQIGAIRINGQDVNELTPDQAMDALDRDPSQGN
jgi:hypothetical protein